MSGLGNKEIMAQNIKHYMKINNKTRTDMCNALGVKYTTFSDWVNGNSYPRIDKIELMANYFGINKSDLVENPNNKETDELTEYLEVLKNRPEIRMLFQLSKDATKEDVEKAVAIIEALRK